MARALPLNWLLARCERLQSVVLPVEHAIGAHELEPAGKIAAILVEPGGETLAPCARSSPDARPGSWFAPRRCLAARRAARWSLAACCDAGASASGKACRQDALRRRDPLLHHLAPGRLLIGALSSSARQSSIGGLQIVRLAPWRWRAGCAARCSVWSSASACSSASRASSVTTPLLASTSAWPCPDSRLADWPEQPDRLSIGFGRIGVAAPAQIDRSDHVPSLAFFGMLLAGAPRRGRRGLRDSGRSQDLASRAASG